MRRQAWSPQSNREWTAGKVILPIILPWQYFFLLNIYILTMYVLDTEVHSLFRQRFVNIGDASQSAW